MIGGGFFQANSSVRALKESKTSKKRFRNLSSRKTVTAEVEKTDSMLKLGFGSSSSEREEITDEDYLPEINESLLRYTKCYQLITTRMPSENLIKEFLRESYSLSEDDRNDLAANKCVALIEGAQFESGSTTGSYILVDQSEQNIEIVQNFHRLHRSWFQNTNSFSYYDPYGSLDVHENVEAALRYTKVLFGINAGVSLESVLNGDKSLEGIRSGGEFNPMNDYGSAFAGSPNYYFYFFDDDESKRQSRVLMRYYTMSQNSSDKFEFDSDGDENIVLPWVPSPLSVGTYNSGERSEWENILANIDNEISDDSDCNPTSEGFYLQYGKLLGVKEAEDCHLKYVNKRVDDDRWSYNDIENKTMNLTFHPGGGAIGSFDYWASNNSNIVNSGQRAVLRHTNNEKFARRWARQVLSDFLCREVPVLDSIDSLSKNDVNQDAYSLHPFRNDGSCMACHSTLDRMSAAVRNISSYDLGNGQAKNFAGKNYYGIPSRIGGMLNYQYQNCYFDNSLTEGFSEIEFTDILDMEISEEILNSLPSKKGCEGSTDHCDFKTYFEITDTSHSNYCFQGSTYPTSSCSSNSSTSSFTEINISDMTSSKLKDVFGPLSCVFDYWTDGKISTLIGYYNKRIIDLGNAKAFPSTSSGEMSSIWPDSNDYSEYSKFYAYEKTPPKGALFMNDINNNRIEVEVLGMADLAEALRDTPDFYACSVKRYFQFFTGSDIPLFFPDLNDSFNPVAEMSQNEYEKLEYIRDRGMKYHDGNMGLFDIMKDLIMQPYFLESVLGTFENGQVKMDVTDTKIDQYFDNLNNCKGCHSSTDLSVYDSENPSAPKWLTGFNDSSDTCTTKKLFLEGLISTSWSDYNLPGYGQINSDYAATPYITPGDPCNSLLYLVMEDSEESCGNTESRHNKNGSGSGYVWMSSAGSGVDQDLLEEMIYKINSDGKFNSDVSDECEDGLEEE